MEEKIDKIIEDISSMLNDSGAYKKIAEILENHDVEIEHYGYEIEDKIRDMLTEYFEDFSEEWDEDTLQEMADDMNFERSRDN